MSSLRAVSAASCLLLFLLAGCTATVEVSVQVLTDLAPLVEFDRVVLERDGREVTGRVVTAGQRFDRPVVLEELRDLAPGTNVRLTVALERGGGRVLSRTISTRIDASRVLLFVLSSACRGVSCPPADEPSATECSDGVCVPPQCQGAACSPDAAVEPEPDAGVALDAPRSDDASMDAAPGLDAALEVDAFSMLDAPSLDAASTDVAFYDAPAIDALAPSDAAAPADAWSPCGDRPAGFVCRPSTGPCDPEEQCTGTSTACPRNALAPAGTVCRDRARGHPCDAVETCTGRSALCPDDANEADGTRCDQFCGPETCEGGVCTGGVSCAPGYSCCGDLCTLTPLC